ncbi:unnamed protein product [Prorocentrum cordatum]|uniref:Uncharacterized protein n=1 Tax=Prorocentrum cordatum TaxID=2364126 RepID=A0ABN9RA29_9DINO|nr:unnamed protein product [Polarella glacialis]
MSHRQHGYGQRQGSAMPKQSTTRYGQSHSAKHQWTICKKCGRWGYGSVLSSKDWRCDCGAQMTRKGKDKQGSAKDGGLAKALEDVSAQLSADTIKPELSQQLATVSTATRLANAAWELEQKNKAYGKAFNARKEAKQRLEKLETDLREMASAVAQAEAEVQAIGLESQHGQKPSLLTRRLSQR